MKIVFLIQRSQNSVGLEVDYDLSLGRGLDDAADLIKWSADVTEETEYRLAYYDGNSAPLLEWLALTTTFKVVVDKEMVLSSPLPSRLNIETITMQEVVALCGTPSTVEPEIEKTGESFSDIESEEIDE